MSENDRKKFPMLGKITETNDGNIISERVLSLNTDLYMNDHRFNKISLFPGIMGLESFAELINYTFQRDTEFLFTDVSFTSGIFLKNDDPTVLYAKIKPFGLVTEAVLKTPTTKSKELKTRFEAKIIMKEREEFRHSTPVLKSTPLLTKDFIYQVLPHGTSFQVLKEINSIDKNQVIAIIDNKDKKIFDWKTDKLLISPLSIEAGFQAIGLYEFIIKGKASLPSKIKQLIFYNTNLKPHYVLGYPIDENSYTFLILSLYGDVIASAIGYKTIETDMGDVTPVLERLRAHRIRQLVKRPKLAWLEVISCKLINDKLSREPSFANSCMHIDESELIYDLTNKNQLANFLELFAIKRAIRVVGIKIKMTNYKVSRDEFNDPYFIHKKRRFYFTITKTDNYVLAMISLRKKIGIEIQTQSEKIQQNIKEILIEHEKELLSKLDIRITDDILKRIVLAKKAAIKSIGSNCSLNMKDITIINIKPNHLDLIIDLTNIFPNKKEMKKKISVEIGENENHLLAVAS
ncbi:MAG: hypothetical protein FK734_09375 [Asgard group archaeon]|nr:hypothetical protein [Asgard group archaeon]